MPGYYGRKPKAGDKTLSKKFLRGLDDRLRATENITGAGGMSLGAGGVALPDLRDDPALLKLIHCSTLPGYYGGFSNNYGTITQLHKDAKTYIDSTNTKSTGLPITRENRILYPREGEIYEVTADRITTTGETADHCINPTPFPYNGAFGWFAPLANDPDKYVMVAPQVDFSQASMGWYWHPSGFGSDTSGVIECGVSIYGTPKKLEWLWLSELSSYHSSTTNYAIPGHDDVFLLLPGHYQVTIGGDFHYSGGGGTAQPYLEEVLETENFGSPPHKHELKFRRHWPIAVQLALVQNFSGGPMSNYQSQSYTNKGVEGVIHNPGFGGLTHIERTFHISTGLAGGEGKHWTRLSLLVWGNAYNQTPSTGKVTVKCHKAYMQIRPAMGGYQSGHISPGFNAFLGEKTEANPFGYQWWGSGDRPRVYDENGNDKGEELS